MGPYHDPARTRLPIRPRDAGRRVQAGFTTEKKATGRRSSSRHVSPDVSRLNEIIHEPDFPGLSSVSGGKAACGPGRRLRAGRALPGGPRSGVACGPGGPADLGVPPPARRNAKGWPPGAAAARQRAGRQRRPAALPAPSPGAAKAPSMVPAWLLRNCATPARGRPCRLRPGVEKAAARRARARAALHVRKAWPKPLPRSRRPPPAARRRPAARPRAGRGHTRRRSARCRPLPGTGRTGSR